MSEDGVVEPILCTSCTSCISLEKDVVQLKECMDIMQETVQMQQVSLDTIEDAIQSSKEEVKQAHQEIVVTDTYQSSYYYVMAAGSAVFGLVVVLLL